MSLFVVDWEADGPVPGLYSGVCFGAVLVDESLDKTFYGEVAPISDQWVPEALAVSGFSREEHVKFRQPEETIPAFHTWVLDNNRQGRPIFISDNPAFDWQFTNYYGHRYTNSNPFGHSARRIGDLYCGLTNDFYARWKHLRQTTHDHNPVNDCIGNAEVLLHMREKMGLKFK